MSSNLSTVLVVDDTDASRYAIARHLRQAGFEVWEAASGQDALRLAQQQPSLIVLDIKLPDILGYEVCRKLKTDPATAAIPILHISATFQMSADRVRGLEGGADGFLTEPLEPEELVAHVKLLLRLRDTTESLRQSNEQLRQARDQLAVANASLERIVQERTAELRELVADLEYFSYTITHDMRAPLRAMQGFGDLLLEECRSCPNSERHELLNRIRTAAERMDRLITDALNYNRTLREAVALVPVDTAALVRGMLASYPQFAPPVAHVTLAGDLPPVMGNEAALTQCFSNLLNNAVKFSKEGAIPEIRVGGERRGDKTRLWVEDCGIGIPKESQAKIFGLFEKLETGSEGTGIGLALVRKVAHRMRGTVGLESEPGKGSRFWIELPACDLAGNSVTEEAQP